ncbi:MAG: transglutaminase-like cysteine peptidase [Candidatus Omnitrophica bacterium]|nr:transglutaminase-like cysteine peptidase [Candidatus Omnitrophota bacterium]
MRQKTHIKLTFASLCTLCVFVLTAKPCFATQKSIPIGHLHIRQEQFFQNGVLISRPVQSDQKIVAIVSQNQIRTIEDYAAWLEKNMIYQTDPKEDQWLTPEEFLKIKRGDCEDFAFLNSHALRVLGFTPHIITLSSTKNAHAICAFKYAGAFYWLDNTKLKSSTATDLTAFVKELTNQLHYLRSFELDPVSKRANLIYQAT